MEEMKYRFLSVLLAVTLLLGWSPLAGTARADRLRCANTSATVTFSEPADGETACTGAVDAIAFLEANGFNTGGPIEIHMVTRIPEDKMTGVWGCFDRPHGQIYVLKYSACRGVRQCAGIFGLPTDRDLHRSLVAHEVAHAITSHNPSVENAPWVAQEYIAYVTQLATMPPGLRGRVLARFRGEGFETSAQINLTILMVAPDVFAVRAYRHFAKLEKGAAFFRRLLTGELHVNHEFSP